MAVSQRCITKYGRVEAHAPRYNAVQGHPSPLERPPRRRRRRRPRPASGARSVGAVDSRGIMVVAGMVKRMVVVIFIVIVIIKTIFE